LGWTFTFVTRWFPAGRNRYLFEFPQRTQFTARRVEQIVSEYAAIAELPEHAHPHLLRHQMLTWLTAQGLKDAQIQLFSGHASKKSLPVYHRLPLSAVESEYPTGREAGRNLAKGCALEIRPTYLAN
jgi:site-specific recombinase XerD